MAKRPDTADLQALIQTTRSHFLSFQREFLLVLESLVDIACAILEKKRGTYRHDGLRSILRQAHGLLGTLVERLAGYEGDIRIDDLKKTLMKESSRMRNRGSLSKADAYRQAALKAVINVIEKQMKAARPPTEPRSGRMARTTSGVLKKVAIR